MGKNTLYSGQVGLAEALDAAFLGYPPKDFLVAEPTTVGLDVTHVAPK